MDPAGILCPGGRFHMFWHVGLLHPITQIQAQVLSRHIIISTHILMTLLSCSLVNAYTIAIPGLSTQSGPQTVYGCCGWVTVPSSQQQWCGSINRFCSGLLYKSCNLVFRSILPLDCTSVCPWCTMWACLNWGVLVVHVGGRLALCSCRCLWHPCLSSNLESYIKAH
jgi:hypothetical protein